MQLTLTFATLAALFATMTVLAVVPGVSALAVSARSAAYGFGQGAATTLGVVAGDIVFILLALFGLVLLAEVMGPLFVFIRVLGGIWLIGFGILLWRSGGKPAAAPAAGSTLRSGFLTGLFITLGDQKAILFYLGFFPAFLDLAAMTYADAFAVVVIAGAAVGGVKLGYAAVAARAGASAGLMSGSSPLAGTIARLAAGVLVAVGVFLILGSVIVRPT